MESIKEITRSVMRVIISPFYGQANNSSTLPTKEEELTTSQEELYSNIQDQFEDQKIEPASISRQSKIRNAIADHDWRYFVLATAEDQYTPAVKVSMNGKYGHYIATDEMMELMEPIPGVPLDELIKIANFVPRCACGSCQEDELEKFLKEPSGQKYMLYLKEFVGQTVAAIEALERFDNLSYTRAMERREAVFTRLVELKLEFTQDSLEKGHVPCQPVRYIAEDLRDPSKQELYSMGFSYMDFEDYEVMYQWVLEDSIKDKRKARARTSKLREDVCEDIFVLAAEADRAALKFVDAYHKVYKPHGKPIYGTDTYKNGLKEIRDYRNFVSGRTDPDNYVECCKELLGLNYFPHAREDSLFAYHFAFCRGHHFRDCPLHNAAAPTQENEIPTFNPSKWTEHSADHFEREVKNINDRIEQRNQELKRNGFTTISEKEADRIADLKENLDPENVEKAFNLSEYLDEQLKEAEQLQEVRTEVDISVSLDLFETIKGLFWKKEELSGWSMDQIIAIVNFVFSMFNNPTLTSLAAMALQTACAFKVGTLVCRFLKWSLSLVNTQMELGEVIALMGSVITMVCGGLVPDKSGFVALLRRMDQIPKAICGFEKMVEYLQRAITFIRDWATGRQKSLLPEFFEKWYDEGIETLKNPPTPKYKEVAKLKSLIDDARYIGKDLMTGGFNTEISRRFDRLVSDMKTQVYMLEKMGVNSEPRIPPMTLYMWGGSGIGKSILSHFVPVAVLARMEDGFDAENYAKHTYVRDKTNVYWDGMNDDVYIIQYDDIFQEKLPTQKDQLEPMEIIRCKNSVPWMLHMAGVEQKGRIYNNATFVCATANKQKYHFDGIHDQLAVWRRFDVHVHVRIKDEYATDGMADPLKIQALGDGPQTDIYLFDIEKIDSKCKYRTTATVEFDDFIDYCCNMYKKVRTEGVGLQKSVKDFVAEYLQKTKKKPSKPVVIDDDDDDGSSFTDEEQKEHEASDQPTKLNATATAQAQAPKPTPFKIDSEEEEPKVWKADVLDDFEDTDPKEDLKKMGIKPEGGKPEGYVEPENPEDAPPLSELPKTEGDSPGTGNDVTKVIHVKVDRKCILRQQEMFVTHVSYATALKALRDGFISDITFNRRFYKHGICYKVEYSTSSRLRSVVMDCHPVTLNQDYVDACKERPKEVNLEDVSLQNSWKAGNIDVADARELFGKEQVHFLLYTIQDEYKVNDIDDLPEAEDDPVYSELPEEEGRWNWRFWENNTTRKIFKKIAAGLATAAALCGVFLLIMKTWGLIKRVYNYIKERVTTESIWGQTWKKKKVTIEGDEECCCNGDCKKAIAKAGGFIQWLKNQGKFVLGCASLAFIYGVVSEVGNEGAPPLQKTKMKELITMAHDKYLEIDNWCPAKTQQFNIRCVGCNKISFFRSELGYCRHCQGAAEVEMFYHDASKCEHCTESMYPDRFETLKTPPWLHAASAEEILAYCKKVEWHHVNPKGGWCYTHLEIPGAIGGKSRKHHICSECTEVVLHRDYVTQKCYACLRNIKMPAEYYHKNSCKLHAVEINANLGIDNGYWCPYLLGSTPDEFVCTQCHNVARSLDCGVCDVCSGKCEPDPEFFHTGCGHCFRACEGLLDAQLDQAVSSKFFCNSVHVGEGSKRLMNGLFIGGLTMLVNAHYIDYMHQRRTANENSRISFGFLGSDDVFTVDLWKCRTILLKDKNDRPKDAYLLILPRGTVNPLPDIRKFFVKSKDLDSIEGGDAVRIGHSAVQTRYGVKEYLQVTYFEEIDRCLSQWTNDPYARIGRCIHNGWTYYGAQNKPGDCGSIIVKAGIAGGRCILGIHTAGDRKKRGWATTITQEDLQLADVFGAPQIPDLTPPTRQVKGSFVHYGDLSDPPAGPEKTVLQPSLVHGEIQDPTTAPAQLKFSDHESGEPDPLMRAARKSGKPCPELDDHTLEKAFNGVKQRMTKPGTKYNRVLTTEEAIFGIEGDDYINRLEPTTSPGYPWSNKREQKPGKKTWINYDSKEVRDDLVTVIKFYEEQLKEGKRPFVVWTDILKDERRALDKLYKTRLFSAGPVHFNIVFRKYFLGFIAACMEMKIENGSAVGINPYGHDWDRLAMFLLEVGNNMIGGDFSNYDGTLHAQILWKVCDMANEFYNDGNDWIRVLLFMEIVHSIHLLRGTVYNWHHSNPSGNPMTSILNTIYFLIALCYIWLQVAPDPYKTTEDFFDMVRAIAYGDDNIVSVADKAKEWISQVTLTDAFQKLGMEFTDELKTGAEVPPHRLLEMISFLKRRFVKEPSAWYGPMDESNIKEMSNWIKLKNDKRSAKTATKENLENMCMEAALLPKEKFQAIVNKVKELGEKYKFNAFVLTQPEYKYRMKLGVYAPAVQMGIVYDPRETTKKTFQKPETCEYKQKVKDNSLEYGGIYRDTSKVRNITQMLFKRQTGQIAGNSWKEDSHHERKDFLENRTSEIGWQGPEKRNGLKEVRLVAPCRGCQEVYHISREQNVPFEEAILETDPFEEEVPLVIFTKPSSRGIGVDEYMGITSQDTIFKDWMDERKNFRTMNFDIRCGCAHYDRKVYAQQRDNCRWKFASGGYELDFDGPMRRNQWERCRLCFADANPDVIYNITWGEQRCMQASEIHGAMYSYFNVPVLPRDLHHDRCHVCEAHLEHDHNLYEQERYLELTQDTPSFERQDSVTTREQLDFDARIWRQAGLNCMKDQNPEIQADLQVNAPPMPVQEDREVVTWSLPEGETSMRWHGTATERTDKTDKVHSIASFLKRPIQLATKTWSKSSVRGTNIITIKFPQIFKNTQYENKLRGLKFLRATFCVKVQIQSMQFQSGMVYGSWLPCEEPFTYPTMTIKTSRPGQPMNVEFDTTRTFRFGYTCPEAAMVTTSMKKSAAVFKLDVYSKITVDDARVLCWVWLENVDAHLPTPMGQVLPTEDEQEEFVMYDELESLGVAIQADGEQVASTSEPNGTTWGGTPTEADANMAQNQQEAPQPKKKPPGWLSTIGGILQSGAEAAAGVVAGGFGKWAVRAAATGIKALFGYTKIRFKGAAMVMRPQFCRNLACSDTADDSKSFLLSKQADVEIGPGMFGTGMDVAEVARTPTFWYAKTWSKTAVNDSNLMKVPIKLNNFLSQAKAAQSTDPKPVWYSYCGVAVPAMFSQYWCGGIVIIFHFVKTQFHSGTLRFVWNPREDIGATIADKNMGAQEFCDMRANSMCIFTIPFASEKPVLKVSDVLGTIYVDVANSLIANDNVEDSIEILVEVAAARDLMYALPKRATDPSKGYHIHAEAEAGNIDGASKLKWVAADSAPTDVDCQSDMLDLSNYREIIKKGYFGKQIVDVGEVNSAMAIASACGDPFLSFKSLAQRFYATDLNYALLKSYFPPMPYKFSELSMITRMYAFATGSIRIKYMPKTDHVVRNVIAYNGTAHYESTGGEQLALKAETVCEFEVPYINDIPYGYVYESPFERNPENFLKGIDAAQFGAATNKCKVFLAGAPNFRTAYFLGYPAIG